MKGLSIKINKYYFDSDGVLIDKNTITEELKQAMPFFIMGRYDYDNQYRNARNVFSNNWKFLKVSNYLDFQFMFSGINNIQNKVDKGDVVLYFVDSVINPQFYCVVLLSTPNFGLTGIVKNTEFSSINFDIDSDNPNEDFNSIISVGTVSVLGNEARDEKVSLSDYFGSYTRPENPKIKVPIPVYFSANTYFTGTIGFETSKYSISFNNLTIR